MIIDLQKASDPSGLELYNWDIGFYGSMLDDRGRAAVQQLQCRTKNTYPLMYYPENFEISIDSRTVSVDNLELGPSETLKGHVVLEATTLGFSEILLCCKNLKKVGVRQLDIMYVEPGAYRNTNRRHLLRRRDFELSKEVPGYKGIPGSTFFFDDRADQKYVFMLGYEESRLRRAFEELQDIVPSNTSLIVGVPAFKPGWETDSLANNIAVIREQKIMGEVQYCGADNPKAVVDYLSNLYRSLDSQERMFIAPIGTKPHGVGAALFVTEHPRVGVLYDHPQRSRDRSSELGNWHLYSIKFL